MYFSKRLSFDLYFLEYVDVFSKYNLVSRLEFRFEHNSWFSKLDALKKALIQSSQNRNMLYS